MTINKRSKIMKPNSPQTHDFVELDYLSNKLIIGMKDPAKKEIQEYNNGEIILKLIIKPKAIFIVFKIGSLDWSDFSYSICTILKEEKENYKKKFNEYYSKEINLLLIDVNSNTTKVDRILKLSDKFAKKLRDSIIEQCDSSHSVKECNIEIKKLYTSYNTEQLSLSKLVNVTCKIESLRKKEYIEVIYDEYGWETNKKIPQWIYIHVHDLKASGNKGIIIKRDIPDELLKKGVVKCTYSSDQGKHLRATLYKLKKKAKR